MSNFENTSLPSGWAETTLGCVVDPRLGKAKPQTMPNSKFIGMEQVEAHTMRLLGTIPAKDMKSAANIFQAGDVLYGRLRSYLNKVYQPDFSGLCSGEFIVLPESTAAVGKFIKYRLNAGDFVRFASRINTGDRPRVDFDQIKNFGLILPPKPEQERIADTLDELLSSLEAGVAALERVRGRLKSYRAAALKSAVEGAATASWREERGVEESGSDLLERILVERRRLWEAKKLRVFEESGREPPKNWKSRYVEPRAAITTGLPGLPKNWCWATIEQLTTELSNGFGKRSQVSGSPRVVLRLADISGGEVSLADPRKINCTDDDIEQYALAENDILVLRVNGSADLVGRFVLVRGAEDEVLYCDHFIRARPVSKSLSPWLRAVADTDRFRRYIELKKVSSAGQNTINQAALMSFAIPLPPEEERVAISEMLQEQFSVIDHVGAGTEAKLNGAQALRQSILRDAFAGKLVSQNSQDEPALELLKRFRAEQESGSSKFGKSRKRKAR